MTSATVPFDPERSGTWLNVGPERVLMGAPAGEAVRREAERLGARRVFVVSSGSLAALAAQGQGPLHAVVDGLGERCAGRYTAVRAHSPREDVVDAVREARRVGADLLVSVGGGSVTDATKAMLACAWMGVDDEAVLGDFRHDAPDRRALVPGPNPLRMVAVPTMLAAAEFTPSAGITATATRSKQALRHPLLVPLSVVLDPEATRSTPLPLLFTTGLRAVDHAVESFCSPRAHALSELHSRLGLQCLVRALPAIRDDPAALAPRREAQLGMWQAITGSSTGAGTGASHGIGYALGAGFDVSHGHTSCVLLPAVLRFNEPVDGDRQRALAAALGRPEVPLADQIAALVRALGLPSSLADVGVAREQWPELARRALGYEPVRRNPRPIRGEDDVLQVLALTEGA
jgi:maleylacetate reductase